MTDVPFGMKGLIPFTSQRYQLHCMAVIIYIYEKHYKIFLKILYLLYDTDTSYFITLYKYNLKKISNYNFTFFLKIFSNFFLITISNFLLKVHCHENFAYYDFYIIKFVLFFSLIRILPFVSMLFH